jgi:serine phosphatase RsbU (regulator of sigma subunit)
MPITPQTESDVELALAAELQAALLPNACPDDCPHQVAAARNRMSGAVGGDFYTFLRLHRDQVAVLVGDVVGHGVHAALVMAQIMGYLRSRPGECARPQKAVSALNEMLLDLGRRTDTVIPCSLLYGVIDGPSGTSFFVNMGHPPPFLCKRDECRIMPLSAHNMILGVESFEPQETCHTFTPGERMVLYTDGLTDAADADGERFGTGRLHEAVNRYAGDDAQTCADGVFAAVAAFRGKALQSDDETIVVIDRV